MNSQGLFGEMDDEMSLFKITFSFNSLSEEFHIVVEHHIDINNNNLVARKQ